MRTEETWQSVAASVAREQNQCDVTSILHSGTMPPIDNDDTMSERHNYLCRLIWRTLKGVRGLRHCRNEISLCNITMFPSFWEVPWWRDRETLPLWCHSYLWPQFYWRTNVGLDCRIGLDGDREWELEREREKGAFIGSQWDNGDSMQRRRDEGSRCQGR